MKEFIKKNYKNVKILLDNIDKDHVSEYSSQCSYYTILSFIPFAILLITMVQYTGINQNTLFNILSNMIPSSMEEMVIGIIQEVYSKSIGTISISIIFILWPAGKGLYALIKGIQSIYHTEGEQGYSYIYLRIKSIVETIAFIMLISIGLTLLVFGNSLISIIKAHLGDVTKISNLSFIITELGLIFVTFIVFLIVYKIMPKRKITIKSQIPGAIIGAILLNIISFVFSKYLDIFKGFSITYGSLTTLMLIMMWTYSCFYTLFLGAEINKMLERPSVLEEREGKQF